MLAFSARTSFLLVPVCCAICGCGEPKAQTKEELVEHTFSWFFEEHVGLHYLLDGVDLGLAPTGADRASDLQLAKDGVVKVVFPKDAVVELVFPAEDQPKKERVCWPFVEQGLIESWLDKGAKIQFWCGDKQLEPVYVSWTCLNYEEPVDLVINGKIAGPIAQAESELAKIQVTESTLIIIMCPFWDDGSFVIVKPEGIRKARCRWDNWRESRAKGVIVLQRSPRLRPDGTPFGPSPHEPSKPPGMHD